MPQIKIHSLRFGFATNSSSSHSVIFLNQAPEPPQYELRSVPEFCPDDFGWDAFRLKDSTGKMEYLAVMLWRGLYVEYQNEKVRLLVLRKIFEGLLDFSNDDKEAIRTLDISSIDHASIAYPKEGMDGFRYGELLRDFLLDSRVNVLGGNDNDDGDPFDHLDGKRATLSDACHLRHDKKADVWTLFNVYNGAKVRFGTGADNYTKSNVPELVDLKVTDKCSFGCKFCYQGSTPEGKHGSFFTAGTIIEALADLGTFEIAIGGGEPTEYVAFPQIIGKIYDMGMIPNFTTNSDEWLKNRGLVEMIKKCCGSIGVSVNTVKDVEKYKSIKKAMSWHVSVNAQVVVGAHTPKAMTRIVDKLRECDADVLFLGWKNMGRGETFKQKKISAEVMNTILNILHVNAVLDYGDYSGMVSVDTAFVDMYADVLRKHDVSEILTASPEGKFSCYIDAIEGTIARSSYTSEGIEKLEDMDAAEIKMFFSRY